jgi:hypothetical protein
VPLKTTTWWSLYLGRDIHELLQENGIDPTPPHQQLSTPVSSLKTRIAQDIWPRFRSLIGPFSSNICVSCRTIVSVVCWSRHRNSGDDRAEENREKRFGCNKKSGKDGRRHDPTSSLKTERNAFRDAYLYVANNQ